MSIKLSFPLFSALIIFTSFTHADNSRLVEVASFGQRQALGITFTDKNRLFVTFPRENGSLVFDNALVEIVEGKELAYPNIQWNKFNISNPTENFINAHAVVAQGDNLWVLDSAGSFPGLANEKRTKLIKIDLTKNEVQRVYHFNDLPVGKTQLNDVRIDYRRCLAYFSDPRSASIVVLDLNSGESRFILTGHPTMLADPNYILRINGVDVVSPSGRPFNSNVNGIALTHDGKWLYFRAINQLHLYRIETRFIADKSLDDSQIAKHIEDLGEVGVSHGMIADKNGSIYMTNSVNNAVTKVTSSGEIKRVLQDKRLSWPDTFALDVQGVVHLTDAQINRSILFNTSDKTEFPYRLYKIVSNQ